MAHRIVEVLGSDRLWTKCPASELPPAAALEVTPAGAARGSRGTSSAMPLEPLAAYDRRGHRRKRVERYAAGPEQSLFHVWQMGIEEMAYRRVQVVRLPELSGPSPSRFLWRAG